MPVMFNYAEPCRYCGENCPQDEEHACDGYLGDIDGLYSLEQTHAESWS